MKRLVFPRTDGGVTIRFWSPKQALPGETEDQTAARLASLHPRAVFAGPPIILDETEIPPKDAYRNAWKLGNRAIDHDMPKAKAIHLERIRRVRDRELTASDTEFVKLQDIGTPQEIAAVKSQRQKLRDAPNSVQVQVDAAKDITELKAIWPQDLPTE